VFGRDYFVRELRNRAFASADALQVMNKEVCRVIDRLAVLRQLAPCGDEIGQFTLREANGFSPVAFKRCALPHPLRVSFRARFEKFAALAECAEIE
jgi:hypothetical protein